MEKASDSALIDSIGGWLKSLGIKDFEVLPVPGDVSLRRYFRLRHEAAPAIVAAYPEVLRQTADRFVETTALLAAAGVRVPRIHAFDPGLGLMLIEDAGATTMFEERAKGWDWLSRRLAAARDAAEEIQRLDAEAVAAINPPLDAKALFRELEMTWELHLEPTGLCGPQPVARELRRCLVELCDRLEADALVPCHRDYMARNLVCEPTGTGITVLDHQDLRLGPPEYDLASLTNDSLFLTPAQCIEIVGEETWRSAGFRRAAAQRSLKIVGTFVSFSRRGSSHYLPWVDDCIARAFGYLTSLPEGEALSEPLRASWQAGSRS